MSNSSFSIGARSSTGLLLSSTSAAWQREVLTVLTPHGITHAQFVIMTIAMHLAQTEGEAAQASIVAISRLDKMTVSSGLRKLEKLKLLQRHAHSQDARVYGISLTNKGGILTRKLARAVEGVDKMFFGSLNKSDQRSLAVLLAHLAQIEQ